MKIPHLVVVKAPGLLPMLYTVSELASDLKIPDRTLRDWLDAGAPHQRDSSQRIWINGEQFKQWVQEKRKRQRPTTLLDHQAYCLKCKTVVELHTPEIIPVKGRLINIKGTCPHCGCVINRGGRDGKTG